MRFSVMVAVYNAQTYLDACVQSVLSQTCPDFELLLVDDGSTDGSGKICDAYAERDRRVRVLHTDNRGVFLTRAFAESHARGDYLVHFDADDTVEPDLLQALSDAIDRNAPDLLFYDYTLCGADGQTQVRSFGEQDTLYAGPDMQAVRRLLLGGDFNTLCNKCFHRRLVACTPTYLHYPRLRHGEDLLRSAYLVTGADSAYYLRRSFYNYRTAIGHAGVFHEDTFRNYAVIAQQVQKLLCETTDWNDDWQAAFCALCRRQLENLIRTIAGSDISLSDGAGLLQTYAVSPFFRDAMTGAPDTLKFRLLKRKHFRLLLTLHRIKGARYAK